MGIESCLIDKMILTIERKGRQTLYYLNKDVNHALFDEIKTFYDGDMLRRIEMINTTQDLTMCVFCEKNKFHIGVVDIYEDINFYYDNGSNNTNLVAIDGEVFEERTIGMDKDLLWDIVRIFVEEGERYKGVNWIEE